jgi:hypothetical protein
MLCLAAFQTNATRGEIVETDEGAMELLETEHFDLVLLGHQSALPKKGIDQRLRERFLKLATLTIEIGGVRHSVYPSRVTAMPQNVIEALHEMLGEGANLTTIQLPILSDESPSA